MPDSLGSDHDVLLLDLDGTLYTGATAVPHAAESLRSLADEVGGNRSPRLLYVTNNASRAPTDVAAHLVGFGFTVDAGDVVTSAQAAARLIASRLPAGSRVLVVGTEALAEHVAQAGLVPVRDASAQPAAVVQGHSPHTDWHILAEAALAIRGGALWVAANRDTTLPSDRGLLPGNGAMVAALEAATSASPLVAGKPEKAIFHDALARGSFRCPLVVGDRLDTDIAGAQALGLPSLYVGTGVSQPLDVLAAPPGSRPDHLGAALRALLEPASTTRAGAAAPIAASSADGATLIITASAARIDPIVALRAIAPTAWEFLDRVGGPVTVRPEGPAAESVVRQWTARARSSACGRISASVSGDE
ncbi:HAD-IIA family hydrolase [Hoyosella sp. G463]|uniref:HAD-IIA family hydrolase n=1 Tax=Lolliginicoccus lacisalsi TaxID=2742202 RepID=A0A927PKC1_9ACTN|nr:HAD-IIA family hydrolase [Lolliginicoccus lacisalsi]MBD8505548.1 HAD-IIA family hydrolase [Lolliginicoccus lacisalsi]